MSDKAKDQESVVIVGGGLAGANVAESLRERGFDGPVTIIGAEDHLPYERPPLSKDVLLGKKSTDDATVHDTDWWKEHAVDVRTGERAVSIDRDRKVVVTDKGELPYGTLVLATGSEPRRLEVADDSGAPVHYLRTVEDSNSLKDALTEGAKVVIIGGGWIGLEVASAARNAGADVTVFEAADLPLVNVLGPEVAQRFADLHRDQGVDLRLGSQVTTADLEGADCVVVGVGATPRTELAEAAGLDVATEAPGGVLVDDQLRTSDPDILAVGDIALEEHPSLGRRVRVEHWDNAIEQGKAATGTITGDDTAYDRQPYFFTDQYDLGMEYFGNVGPDGYDSVETTGDFDGPFRAWWVKDGTVVAAMQANDWDASDEMRDSIGKPPPGVKPTSGQSS